MLKRSLVFLVVLAILLSLHMRGIQYKTELVGYQELPVRIRLCYHSFLHRQYHRSSGRHRQRKILPVHGFVPQYHVQSVYPRLNHDRGGFYPDLSDSRNLGEAKVRENPESVLI